jgi:hypothetical protein
MRFLFEHHLILREIDGLFQHR